MFLDKNVGFGPYFRTNTPNNTLQMFTQNLSALEYLTVMYYLGKTSLSTITAIFLEHFYRLC